MTGHKIRTHTEQVKDLIPWGQRVKNILEPGPSTHVQTSAGTTVCRGNFSFRIPWASLLNYAGHHGKFPYFKAH